MDFSFVFLGIAVLAAAGLIAFAILKARAAKPADAPPPDTRLESVIAQQGAISERFRQAIEAQGALEKALSERLDQLNKRVTDSLHDSAEKTATTLGSIGERLTVIDEAQKNIAALSGQVVSLQDILSDKQTRGAFGQDRMEAIIADQLPPTHYDFQFTLSNGKRPDCIIRLPNVKGVVVVDSKFPLEAFEALRGLGSDDERKPVMTRLKADVLKHVKDIAEKYLIPGEVQTPAIMFVPSESIYAELHASFPDVVQQARRMQVVIVSPHVFMLAINTIQTLMRDQRMREQAHKIQAAVGEMLQDVKRLGERVANLRAHFDRTNKDIGEIETSMKRIESRGAKIAAAELAEPENAPQLPAS